MKLNTAFMWEVFLYSLKGIPVSLNISFVSLIISVPIAFWMAVKKIDSKGFLTKLIEVYVSLIRSTPIVLQILLFYSFLPSLLNYFIKQVLKANFNIFDLNPIIYAYVVFSLNTTALLSEVFRAALLTVDKGQMEAGLSVGIPKALVYLRIIIPQALPVALPNICNVTIALIKSTSLAFLMTVQDITAIAKQRAAFGYNYIEAYIVILVIYIALCSIIQLLFHMAEHVLSRHKLSNGSL